MKFGYYGYDNVFRSMFPPIIAESEARHHSVTWLAPQERGVAAQRKDDMRNRDVVLLGLSSLQTQEELELIDVCRRVVVIADCPSSELRPKAQAWVREQAALPKSERKLKGDSFKTHFANFLR